MNRDQLFDSLNYADPNLVKKLETFVNNVERVLGEEMSKEYFNDSEFQTLVNSIRSNVTEIRGGKKVSIPETELDYGNIAMGPEESATRSFYGILSVGVWDTEVQKKIIEKIISDVENVKDNRDFQRYLYLEDLLRNKLVSDSEQKNKIEALLIKYFIEKDRKMALVFLLMNKEVMNAENQNRIVTFVLDKLEKEEPTMENKLLITYLLQPEMVGDINQKHRVRKLAGEWGGPFNASHFIEVVNPDKKED